MQVLPAGFALVLSYLWVTGSGPCLDLRARQGSDSAVALCDTISYYVLRHLGSKPAFRKPENVRFQSCSIFPTFHIRKKSTKGPQNALMMPVQYLSCIGLLHRLGHRKSSILHCYVDHSPRAHR
jgi:hypothetical protein